MSLREVLFGLLSLVTHVIEAITGFGSTVLALPFGIALAGVAVAVPVLSLHAWLLSAYVVLTDFRKILWRQYATVMLFVLIGLPFGMWAFTALPEAALKAVLAVFMIAVSANGIFRNVRRPPQADGGDPTPPHGWRLAVLYILLLIGGVIHGAFSCGGPLLILYVTRVIKNKGSFRATMCAFWFSLNLILLVRYVIFGVFSPEVVRMSVVTLPFLAMGVLLGNWAHRRIPDRYFTQVVYVVLLISGCFMAYSSFPALSTVWRTQG